MLIQEQSWYKEPRDALDIYNGQGLKETSPQNENLVTCENRTHIIADSEYHCSESREAWKLNH